MKQEKIYCKPYHSEIFDFEQLDRYDILFGANRRARKHAQRRMFKRRLEQEKNDR